MAIQAMNTVIKNNNLMRLKREKFKKTFGGYGKNVKPKFDLPRATPKMLKNIRKQIRDDNKFNTLKIIAVTIVLCLILCFVLAYAVDGFTELLWS